MAGPVLGAGSTKVKLAPNECCLVIRVQLYGHKAEGAGCCDVSSVGFERTERRPSVHVHSASVGSVSAVCQALGIKW